MGGTSQTPEIIRCGPTSQRCVNSTTRGARPAKKQIVPAGEHFKGGEAKKSDQSGGLSLIC